MNHIKIEQVDKCNVVDSRIIAKELGISHSKFFRQIKDNQKDIEKDFGNLCFKNETVRNSVSAVNEVKFAYLNEDQATYLINLSSYGVSQDFANKCNNMGFVLTDVKMFEKKRVMRSQKRELRNIQQFNKELKGEIEVMTLAGRIDILTPTEVIAVKDSSRWKCGLGEVLVYGHYYPNHQKRLHLFGDTFTSFFDMVKLHCTKFDVVVTWED